MIFNFVLNDIFCFVSKGDLYNYTEDNCIGVSQNDISVLSKQMGSETQVMAELFADNFMKSNGDKFQGIILPVNRKNTFGDIDITIVQRINVLGMCIDGKLNFNEYVRRICSKSSAKIYALQRWHLIV